MKIPCSSGSSTASRFSHAPFGLPGRLTIRLFPRMPAAARDRHAFGVIRIDDALIASGIPGASLPHTAIVASGVTSRSAKPVPPVVTISAIFSSSAAQMSAFSMRSRSSGTSTISPTV